MPDLLTTLTDNGVPGPLCAQLITLGNQLCDLTDGVRTTVFAGPGVTGAFGALLASCAERRGQPVRVFHCDRPHLIDTHRPAPFDEAVLTATQSFLSEVSAGEDMAAQRALYDGFEEGDVIVDAVFGRELREPIEMYWREILGWVEGYGDGHRLVALDLPSGYDADTGEMIDFSEDEIVANGYITKMMSDRYDMTISLFGDCPAYHQGTCAAKCGVVVSLEP